MGIVRLEPLTLQCMRDRYTVNGYEVTAQLSWLCKHRYLGSFCDTRRTEGGFVRFEAGERSPP